MTPATVRRLDIAGDRRVVSQRQVRASVMIVVEVIGEDPSEAALTENDAMIKALATDRSDQAFDVRCQAAPKQVAARPSALRERGQKVARARGGHSPVGRICAAGPR